MIRNCVLRVCCTVASPPADLLAGAILTTDVNALEEIATKARSITHLDNLYLRRDVFTYISNYPFPPPSPPTSPY